MLCVTVHVDQQVYVGNGSVMLIGIKGKTVQLGFDFPQDVRILRGTLTPKEPVNSEVPRVVSRGYLANAVVSDLSLGDSLVVKGRLTTGFFHRGRASFAKELLDTFFPGDTP